MKNLLILIVAILSVSCGMSSEVSPVFVEDGLYVRYEENNSKILIFHVEGDSVHLFSSFANYSIGDRGIIFRGVMNSDGTATFSEFARTVNCHNGIPTRRTVHVGGSYYKEIKRKTQSGVTTTIEYTRPYSIIRYVKSTLCRDGWKKY